MQFIFRPKGNLHFWLPNEVHVWRIISDKFRSKCDCLSVVYLSLMCICDPWVWNSGHQTRQIFNQMDAQRSGPWKVIIFLTAGIQLYEWSCLVIIKYLSHLPHNLCFVSPCCVKELINVPTMSAIAADNTVIREVFSLLDNIF